ncbi:alkene reductase [Chryseobacterium sp. Mn2064]|uniref:alkene reductase n=1 Tax=Chryseobacterium sp. Mn2064 TaxID=3395263 RepID=UPI003BCDC509
MTTKDILSPYTKGNLQLNNRVIMSSLTRGRTTNQGLVPTDLHATYYAQRASAGLILTESAWVSKDAIGFINIPGIYTDEQVTGWKKVTEAVHSKGGKIFLQLSHSGSVSHADFFNGNKPKGPSAINPKEKTFTPQGFKDTETPEELTLQDIRNTIEDYRKASRNALKSGFDGIEIHAQIFTLIPQFLSSLTNQRTDEYGGTIENRSRILFEILDAAISVFGTDRVGIKFTPAFFSTGIIRPQEDTLSDYQYILGKLSNYDLAYVHIVAPGIDLSDTPLSSIKDDYFAFFRKHYSGTLMANGGFTLEKANTILVENNADLVSFGTYYIANPDLTDRFQNNWPLATADTDTYYQGGEQGYTDYHHYDSKKQSLP